MPDETQDSNAKSELFKAGVEVAKTVYDDALSPVAKEAGKALGTVGRTVNAVLSPLTGLVWGYEQFQNWLEEKVATRLEGIPEDQIVAPKLSVAVPAIEAVRYCGDEDDLSDLFASLLATSMTKEIAHTAHPGFVGIIKSLCSDEARLIKHFKKRETWPIVDVRSRLDIEALESKLPEGAVVPAEVTNPSSFAVSSRNLSLCGLKAKCAHPENTPAYIDNLERLGVIQFAGDHTLNAPLYEELESSDLVKMAIEAANIGGIMKPFLKRKKFDVSDFGSQLIQACHKD